MRSITLAGASALTLLLASPVSAKQDAYVGTIDGEFKGWEGETIYRLIDGHIIQQSEYNYCYSYSYNPQIVIYINRYGRLVAHIEESSCQDIAVRVLK